MATEFRHSLSNWIRFVSLAFCVATTMWSLHARAFAGTGAKLSRVRCGDYRRYQSTFCRFGRAPLSASRFGARQPPSPRFWMSASHMHLLMSAVDEDEVDEMTKTIDSTWNVSILKKEVQRLLMRCHKKVGKAHERLQTAREQVEALSTDPNARLEDLDTCPDVEAIELELQELKTRLRGLNTLDEALKGIKHRETILPEPIAVLVLDLGVDDNPPTPQPRGPGKAKGPRERVKTRLPYRRYYSFQNTEIRVGKKAQDNDELTLSPLHRDGADWWMHASGCPGSHVVIRCQHESLHPEVVADAAALAARQSKCTGGVIKVSLTRCRDIKKPPGAKAGLVQLTGKVTTVPVNMKEAEKRLNRLEGTVLVN